MSRRFYDDEFKQEAVRMVEEGNQIRSVEINLGITKGVLKDWVKAHREKKDLEGKGAHYKSKDERIRELEKALQRAERERDILKKAVAIFSKEPNQYTGS